MNKDTIIVTIFLVLAVIIQSTIIALPLVWYIILCWYVLQPKLATIVVTFLLGIVVDSLLLRPLGVSSFFYLLSFYIILQYQKKFETATLSFVLFAATIGGFLYFVFFGSFAIFFQTILGTFFAAIVYLIFDKTITTSARKEKSYPTHLLTKGKERIIFV